MRDLDEYQGIYNWKTNLDILSKKNWKSSSRNGHLGSKHWKWAKTRWVLAQWLGFVGKILTGTMLLTPFFVEVFCNVPIISNSGGRDAGRLWPIKMERKLPEKMRCLWPTGMGHSPEIGISPANTRDSPAEMEIHQQKNRIQPRQKGCSPFFKKYPAW